MVDKMVNYWIFIARREEGDLHEMRRVIKNGVWDFVSKRRDPVTKNFKPRTPEYHAEFDIGDYVLFYLAATFPDGSLIKDGRSIIGRARLGSPFVFKGKYGENKPVERFVFLFEPSIFKLSRNIEPRKYGIGIKGRMVVPIKKNVYEALNE